MFLEKLVFGKIDLDDEFDKKLLEELHLDWTYFTKMDAEVFSSYVIIIDFVAKRLLLKMKVKNNCLLR